MTAPPSCHQSAASQALSLTSNHHKSSRPSRNSTTHWTFTFHSTASCLYGNAPVARKRAIFAQCEQMTSTAELDGPHRPLNTQRTHWGWPSAPGVWSPGRRCGFSEVKASFVAWRSSASLSGNLSSGITRSSVDSTAVWWKTSALLRRVSVRVTQSTQTAN